jgi:membrane-associated phospholipid phosphatase
MNAILAVLYLAILASVTAFILFCYTVRYIGVTRANIFNNIRPSEDESNTKAPAMDLDWSPSEGNSFPSGHTMAAVCGGVFWFEISFYMGVLGLFLGLLTGASRVIAKKHWLRDVLTSTSVSISLYLMATYFFL